MNFYYSHNDGLTIFNSIRDRRDVRKAVGINYRVFPKTEYNENSVDSFGKLSIKCWYDKKNIITEVELHDLDAMFYLFNKQVLGISYKELKAILNENNICVVKDEEGLGINILKDTIRFYIPEIEEERDFAKVESIWLKIPKLLDC